MLAGCHSTFLSLNQHNLGSFSHWPVQTHFRKIAIILAKPNLHIISLLKHMQNVPVKNSNKNKIKIKEDHLELTGYSHCHTPLSNTDLITLPSWIRESGTLLKFPSNGHRELLLVGFFSSVIHRDNGHINATYLHSIPTSERQRHYHCFLYKNKINTVYKKAYLHRFLLLTQQIKKM